MIYYILNHINWKFSSPLSVRVGVPYIYNGGVFSGKQLYFLVNITKNYVSKEKICWTNVGLNSRFTPQLSVCRGVLD